MMILETKKTKIICTISDLNCSVDFIRELYENGMNIVRINSAHATIQGAQTIIDNVRAVSERIAIFIDTKGPEVRLTAMEGPVGFLINEGDKIEFRKGIDNPSNSKTLYTNCPSFVDDVPVGASILIDDGSIELNVISKDNEKLVCEARNSGIIKGRKIRYLSIGRLTLISILSHTHSCVIRRT